MSAKQVGLATLIHRALAALHDDDPDLAKGSLYQAMHLFKDKRIESELLGQFAFVEAETIQAESDQRITPWMVSRIIKDWIQYHQHS